MSLTKKQTWAIRVWFLLVAALALFPPFEKMERETIGLRSGTIQSHELGSNTRHGFVIHREWIPPVGDELVFDGANLPTIRGTVTSINLAALFCELLAVSAVAGVVFLSLKEKSS